MLKSTLFVVEIKDTPSGSDFEVSGIYPYDIRNVIPTSKFIPISAKIAEMLIAPLREGELIKVSPSAVKNKGAGISIDDFSIVKITGIERIRAQELTKAYERFGATVSATSLLKNYMYFSTAILLAEHGFLITDENREEKYLEIINTGDESLLRTLEDYLEARDNLSYLSLEYRSFSEYINKVKAAKTIKALKDVAKEYGY